MNLNKSVKRIAAVAAFSGLLLGNVVLNTIQASDANAIVADAPLPPTSPVSGSTTGETYPTAPRVAPGPFASSINWISWGPAKKADIFANGDFHAEPMYVDERHVIECSASELDATKLPQFQAGDGSLVPKRTVKNGYMRVYEDQDVNPATGWSYFNYLYHHPGTGDPNTDKSIVIGNSDGSNGGEFYMRVTCKEYFSDDNFATKKPVPLAGLVVADAEHMGAREYISAKPVNKDDVKWTLLKSGLYGTPSGYTEHSHWMPPQKGGTSNAPFSADLSQCPGHPLIRYENNGPQYPDPGSKSIGITSTNSDISTCRPTTVMLMEGGSDGEATSFDVRLIGEGATLMALGAVAGNDLGDAPKSYGFAAATIAGALNGKPITADYVVTENFEGTFDTKVEPRLGPTVFPDGQPSYNDDATDDDGWTQPEKNTGFSFTLSDSASSVLAPKMDVEVECTGDGKATSRVVGWIDFNNNGKFDDPAERSNDASCVENTPHKVHLTWPIAQNITSTNKNWMRLRASSDDVIAPTEATVNGEVEDYKIRYKVVRNQKSKDVVKATQNTPAPTGQPEDVNDMFPGLDKFAESADDPALKFTPEFVLVDENGHEVAAGTPVEVHDPKTGELMGVYTMTLVDGKPKVSFQPDVAYANKKSANITAVSEYDVPPITVRVKGSKSFPEGIDATYTPTVIIKPTEPLPPQQSLNNEPGATVSLAPAFPKDDAGHDGVDLTTVKLVKPADCANCVLSADGKTLTVPGQGVWTVDPVTGNMTFKPEDGFIGNPTPVNYTATSTQGKPMGEATLTVTYRKPVGHDQESVDLQGVAQSASLSAMFNDLPAGADTQPNYSLEGADADGSVTVKGPDGKVQGKYVIDKASGKVIFTPEPDFYGTPAPVTVVLTPHVGGDPIKAVYRPRVLNISFAIPLTGVDGGQALVYGVLGAVALAVIAAGAVNARRRKMA